MELLFPPLGSVFPWRRISVGAGSVELSCRSHRYQKSSMNKETCVFRPASRRASGCRSRWHDDCTWEACLNPSLNGAPPAGASTETSMHVERRVGGAVAVLSLIGLIMAPGAATAQQVAHPRASQSRIPVRIVASQSSIPVRVADVPVHASTTADDDRVFITNTPGSPLVTSVSGRSTSITVDRNDAGLGSDVGGDPSWMADDGVAWLPQRDPPLVSNAA